MPKLFTPEEKIKIVLEFKQSKLNAVHFVKKLNITSATLLNWTHAYDVSGIEAFKRSKSDLFEEIVRLRKELKIAQQQIEENKVQREMLKRLEEIIDRKK